MFTDLNSQDLHCTLLEYTSYLLIRLHWRQEKIKPHISEISFVVIAAISAAAFSIVNKYDKTHVHPIVLSWQGFWFTILFQFTLFPYLSGSGKYFSFDSEYGAFGWLTDCNCIFEVIFITAFITGLISNVGFFGAFRYFSIEIVNGTLLLEPFIAQLAGIVLGQDQIPGIKTLIGWLFISACYGLLIVWAKFKQDLEICTKKNQDLKELKETELSFL